MKVKLQTRAVLGFALLYALFAVLALTANYLLLQRAFLDDDISMTCFSCGIHATSMQVHGAHLGDGRYATDWTVPDWATSSLTSSAALWAALDCTAAFYVCGSDGERMAFTVQYAVDQRRAVAPGERVAIVGWNGDYEPVWDGRKRGAASAAFGEDGDVIALARSFWVSAPE